MKDPKAPRWSGPAVVASALLGLAFWIGVIYVIWHFAVKYW